MNIALRTLVACGLLAACAIIALSPNPVAAMSDDSVTAIRKTIREKPVNAPKGTGPRIGPKAPKRPIASRDLSQAFVDRCLEVADELDPEFAKQLRTLCEQDPTEFERIIRRQGPRLTGLAELKASDPKLYQLKLVELRVDASVQRLASEIRAVQRDAPDDTDRIDSLTQQLQGQLQIRLGLELGNQMLYIERMEEQLKELKAQVELQRAEFDSVVQEELTRLTGRPVGIEAARAPAAASP